MPSLFRKSNSDTISLSETNRKVLHKCRMLLIKDLEVTEILEFMAHDECFKADVRDSILALPTREQRVSCLLDRLEMKGDRAFAIFLDALREYYKHLHYALEETLRTVDDKKDTVKEYRLSISGDTVRRYLRKNWRRKADQSYGNESMDAIEMILEDNREETYIDCYAIPTRGKLSAAKWIKSIPNANSPESQLPEATGEQNETYMGTILRDLLFKKVDCSDIPDGVKRPPTSGNVYILDKDNKYGLVKKPTKERHTSDNQIPEFRPIQNAKSNGLDTKVGLDNDWSHEQMPDYTAPPPPIVKPTSPPLERRRQEDIPDGGPPPPLPPKPNNLPPINMLPLSKPKPPEPPAIAKTINTNPNEIATENGEIVKPPPRSTSLVQQSQTVSSFEDKPLPLPTRKSSKAKILKPKERHPSDASLSNQKEKSPHISPASSPPIPPRKYSGFPTNNGNLSGAGALSTILSNVQPPLPETPPPPASQNHETNTANEIHIPEATVDLDNQKMTITTLKTLDMTANEIPVIPECHLDKEIELTSENQESPEVMEGDFDPYSWHADNVFQVRATSAEFKANGDLASLECDATTCSSSNATLTQDPEDGDPFTTTSNLHNPLCGTSSQYNADYETVNTSTIKREKEMQNGEDCSQELDETNMHLANENSLEEIEVPPKDLPISQPSLSRDSTPSDQDEPQHDTSRELSALEDSFKASADSLDSAATTPGSQGEIRSDATTDSGIVVPSLTSSETVFRQPPLLKMRGAMGESGKSSVVGNSTSFTKGASLGTREKHNHHRMSPELSEVQVLADDDSSDANSFYEDIDTFDDKSIPLMEPSERTSVSYLDPKTYFKAIEKMAQKGLCKDRALTRIAIVEEWEASGKALLSREDLVVAEITEAYSIPKTVVEGQSRPRLSENDSNSTDDNQPAKDINEPYRFTKIVYDKLGRAFYVPSKYVRKYGDPDGEPWFYPIEISSHQATLFLGAEKQEGCFLVYKPRNKKPKVVYNLSICCGESGDVVHYHILENLHGDLLIEGHDHTFLNVIELVRYFMRNKSKLATKLRRPLKEATLPVTPGYHYDLQWEVSRSHLHLTGRILGKGNFGVVCAGLYHKHIPVAVKILQNPDCTFLDEDDFIDEARCLMTLNHDHIVRFVGLSCTSKPFYLVTEYLPKGNLQTCLHSNIVPADNIEQLFDVCIQVTSAMEYLENRRFVIHRDLAARNFLVADEMVVKLADFGRAVYVMDDYYQGPRREKIPIKWASPEVLSHSHYSTKSDVWALGVVFWEILSGGLGPYEHFSGEQTALFVTDGGRMEKPIGCPMDLYNTMKRCWCENPDDRPSFASLMEKLKSKSSIYYYSTSPVSNASTTNSPSAKPNLRRGVSTPSGSSNKSFGLGGRNNRNSPTNKKKTHTFMIDTRSQETGRRIPLPLAEVSNGARRNLADKMANSGSETSLVSTMDGEDLSRGGKIRKSIRKMMSMRTKKKSSNLEGLKEDQRDKVQPNNYGNEFIG